MGDAWRQTEPLALACLWPFDQTRRVGLTRHRRGLALSLPGLMIALALPAFATFRIGFTDALAAVALAATPWLTILWVLVVERESLGSIGLARPRWLDGVVGLAGAGANAAISAGVTLLFAKLGIRETQSALMERLLDGPGLLLVALVTNGALLTEISFRAYTIERLSSLLGGNYRIAALAQVVVTTAIFLVGRGWVHGVVWLADDVVFTLFYLKTRNTLACIVAHSVPNLLASLLVAMGYAS